MPFHAVHRLQNAQDTGLGHRRQSMSIPISTPKHASPFPQATNFAGSPTWQPLERSDSGGELPYVKSYGFCLLWFLPASCMIAVRLYKLVLHVQRDAGPLRIRMLHTQMRKARLEQSPIEHKYKMVASELPGLF